MYISETYSEGSTVWYSNWEVGEYSENSVCHWTLEGEVVGYLMDSKEEILIGGSPNDICGRQKW